MNRQDAFTGRLRPAGAQACAFESSDGPSQEGARAGGRVKTARQRRERRGVDLVLNGR